MKLKNLDSKLIIIATLIRIIEVVKANKTPLSSTRLDLVVSLQTNPSNLIKDILLTLLITNNSNLSHFTIHYRFVCSVHHYWDSCNPTCNPSSRIALWKVRAIVSSKHMGLLTDVEVGNCVLNSQLTIYSETTRLSGGNGTVSVWYQLAAGSRKTCSQSLNDNCSADDLATADINVTLWTVKVRQWWLPEKCLARY